MGLALGYRRPFVRAIRLAARAMAFGHTRGPFFIHAPRTERSFRQQRQAKPPSTGSPDVTGCRFLAILGFLS